VAGKQYAEIIEMIKRGGRPLSLTFAPGGTMASSSSPRGPPQQPPAPVDPEAGLTGKAAQKALQDHIMKSGTGDVQKIARLRRASLSTNAPEPDQKAQADVAAQAMAAAIAEAEEEMENEGSEGPISVTFTEPGSLGLKFTPNKQTRNTEVLAVNPGTQAERHRALSPGLILVTVAGAPVAGKQYAEIIEMIKRGGRPLLLSFKPGGTMASSSSPRGPPQQRPQQPLAPVDPEAGLYGKAAQKALQDHIMKSGTGDVQKISRLRRASLIQ
jgi:hypothetical protein